MDHPYTLPFIYSARSHIIYESSHICYKYGTSTVLLFSHPVALSSSRDLRDLPQMAETHADADAPAVAGPGADSSQFNSLSSIEFGSGGAMHAGSFSPTHDI